MKRGMVNSLIAKPNDDISQATNENQLYVTKSVDIKDSEASPVPKQF